MIGTTQGATLTTVRPSNSKAWWKALHADEAESRAAGAYPPASDCPDDCPCRSVFHRGGWIEHRRAMLDIKRAGVVRGSREPQTFIDTDDPSRGEA